MGRQTAKENNEQTESLNSEHTTCKRRMIWLPHDDALCATRLEIGVRKLFKTIRVARRRPKITEERESAYSSNKSSSDREIKENRKREREREHKN